MQPRNVQQAFQLALHNHQSGKFAEAEQLYKQILAHDPKHADAMHYLGVLAFQAGRLDIAEDLIRRAIALAPKVPEPHNNLGIVLKMAGRLDESVAACRAAIALKADFPEAHTSLGNALQAQGNLDDAIVAYRRAVALRPGLPEARNNLGNVLREKGNFEEAMAEYQQAIALRPGYAEVHNGIGNVKKDQGLLEEAIAAYRQAVALRPTLADAHANLGNILKEQGEKDGAIAAYRQAIAHKPDHYEAHHCLATLLHQTGKLEEAILEFRRATELKDKTPASFFDLGNALRDSRKLSEAIAAFQEAIALKADYLGAWHNLGATLQDLGQPDEAMIAFGNAVDLAPDLPGSRTDLGSSLKAVGRLDEAIAAYRKALACDPDYLVAHNNLLFNIHYHPGYDAAAIAAEQRRWNRQFAQPLNKHIVAVSYDRDPDRRLRIGYVSPDLRDHAVARFLVPLLANRDRTQVEVFAYSNVIIPDEATKQLRAHFDVWRDIVNLSDAQAADLIREDRIDILVDLALHTGDNRLLVFAYKPAPVQATYLAYAGSSGLTTMDYRISDPYLDPPGEDESVYSERTIRLPETFWCYMPVVDYPVQPPPVREMGFITFGCLNNFCKVNDPLLDQWIQILSAVPDSRLLLHAHQGRHRQRLLDYMAARGVTPERVNFTGSMPGVEYFKQYHAIDIALDTHPYGGGTTTCDALWMGVPVVSMAGKTAVGRAGSSILSNVGLPELVAYTPERYVQIAIELAGDRPRLERLRSTMRQRMEGSPLMDAPRFSQNFEAAYRQMWREQCQIHAQLT